jgi:hypothetical protein
MMNFDNIPIEVIEEVEIATGFLIEELFEEKNKSPYKKRAMAYLSARAKGESITWEETGKKTVNELWAMMSEGADDEAPKDESELNK